jgi:hypothetical protein
MAARVSLPRTAAVGLTARASGRAWPAIAIKSPSPAAFRFLTVATKRPPAARQRLLSPEEDWEPHARDRDSKWFVLFYLYLYLIKLKNKK